MKVVSLVPSWTESLIQWGVPVVGRTRYCIHPKEAINGIPMIGGTKKQDWEKINELSPDIIIADREENNKDILGRSKAHYHVTHVERVRDMERELKGFHKLFDKRYKHRSVLNHIENDLNRWQKILNQPPQFSGWQKMPGVVEWINQPSFPIKKIKYIIWKKPWMSVAKNTFIGSVFDLMGMGDFFEEQEVKYPSFKIEDYGEDTLLLFSTEPFPFLREIESLKALKKPCAIVDGECFSWFGLRSLEFLEHNK